jgi:phospholipid/cholesterol/gamma-HCH transport system permease protein
VSAVVSPLTWLGRYGLFLARWGRVLFSTRPPPGRTLEEAYKIGVRSLPVLLVISIFVGTNLCLQGYNAFVPLGGQRMVGMFVALAGLRELAPIVAAAMIAAKAGTEMASQIAVMRTREQIDALEVMAVDPYSYLVTPRFLGCLLVMPALIMVADFTTLLSSLAVAVFQLGLGAAVFLEYARNATEVRDLLVGEFKGLVYGAIICTVSCFCGFDSRRGPDGVGAATNTAVVISAVACVVFNTFVSQVLYATP